jgi:hypothetical protein
LYSGNFTINPNVGGTIDISPNYVPDNFVTVTSVSAVSAYTDLNTVERIHDYVSYIRTTSNGIDYGALHDQSFGSLSFTKSLTLDATATSVFKLSADVITLKTSLINDSIIFDINGDFTQSNGNTISDGIKIRSNNLDSEFYFNNVDLLVFFPTLSARDNNTDPGPTITSESVYRFKYNGTVLGVTFVDYAYSRVTVGQGAQAITLLNASALSPGTTNIDFGTTGNLQSILNNQRVINTGVQKASKLIPHSTNI